MVGIESALERARAAAGDKGVSIAGGGSTVQQFIKAGLLDEMQIHVVPASNRVRAEPPGR